MSTTYSAADDFGSLQLRGYDNERDDGLVEIGAVWQGKPFDILATHDMNPGGDHRDAWCPVSLPVEVALDALALAREEWPQIESIEREAQELSKHLLEGSDDDGNWRDAGYRTAVAAAKAIVGDGASADVTRRAVQIVAAAIEFSLGEQGFDKKGGVTITNHCSECGEHVDDVCAAHSDAEINSIVHGCQHPETLIPKDTLELRCNVCGAECSQSHIGDDNLCYDEACPLHALAGPARNAAFAIGDRVEGGEPGTEDYDTGRVVDIDGEIVEVTWDTRVTTKQHATALRPEGSK